MPAAITPAQMIHEGLDLVYKAIAAIHEAVPYEFNPQRRTQLTVLEGKLIEFQTSLNQALQRIHDADFQQVLVSLRDQAKILAQQAEEIKVIVDAAAKVGQVMDWVLQAAKIIGKIV